MDSPVEYRPGLVKSFLMIFPGVFFVGLTVYLLSTGPLPTGTKQIPGLLMCGFGDLAMMALFCYGIAVLRISRLTFASDGFTFQDVGISPLRIRWKDITGISIQNASTQGVTNYRVVVKLKDQNGFLKGLPEKTRRNLEKQSGYLAEGIPIHTQNIQISLAQLRQEFGDRTRAPVTIPGNQTPWSDAQYDQDSANGTKNVHQNKSQSKTGSNEDERTVQSSPIRDSSTQVYRPTLARVVTMIGIIIALLALSAFLFISAPKDPAKEVMMKVYSGVILLLTIALAGTGLTSAMKIRLTLEPEGFVYVGQNGVEVRIPWEDVSGVHIAEIGRDGNFMLMVDLKDYIGYLRSLDANTRKKQEARRATLGDGIPINVQMLGLTPEAAARQILHRAGLS